tara:strand:- start:6032 stop:6649 length:618 start_codon:yes stop_codon:yes gene_type:complete
MNIGLLVLESDPTTEIELRNQLPDYNIYVSRIEYDDYCKLDNLDMEKQVIDAARKLPDLTFDFLVYACTSGSMILGDRVTTTLSYLFSSVRKVITPSFCIDNDLQRRGVKKISLITPYVDEVHGMVARWFSNDYLVEQEINFGAVTDREISEINPSDIEDNIDNFQDSCEAIVLSCTALPTERYLSHPKVVSSNGSMIDYIRRNS